MACARFVCALACASLAPSVLAEPIEATFENLVHGEIVNGQFADVGMSIEAVNFQLPGAMPIAFDTQFINTADPDLQGPPWSHGNLAPNTILGNVIIVPENMVDANNDGIVDDPDDEGARPAGELMFSFDQVMTGFGFDVLDIEGVTQETTTIEFFLFGESVGSVAFTDFTDPQSVFYDETIVFGNNSANRVSPIMIGDVSEGLADGYTSVTIHMGGSSAFDNIVTIPAPASAVLLGLGGFAAARRRR